MTAATPQERFDTLERRVSELEGQFGFLMPTLRQVHVDLINFKDQTNARLDRLESDVGTLKSDVGSLRTDVGALTTDVGSLKSDMKYLRADLPKIVGDAMREVLKERDS